MITLKLKNNRTIWFNMKTFSQESSLTDKFNSGSVSQTAELDLGKQGKHKVSDMDTMKFQESKYCEPIVITEEEFQKERAAKAKPIEKPKDAYDTIMEREEKRKRDMFNNLFGGMK